jgi:hypothetical protein
VIDQSSHEFTAIHVQSVRKHKNVRQPVFCKRRGELLARLIAIHLLQQARPGSPDIRTFELHGRRHQ